MPFDPVPGQFYRIIARHSGKAIGSKDKAPHQGTVLVQVEPATDDHSQQFQLNRHGDYFNLILRDNGQSVDVFSDSQADDAGVGRWHRGDGQWNQQFSLLPAGDGTYYISAHHSTKFLAVKDGGTGNGTAFVQKGWNGGDHFRFRFEPMAPIQGRALREPALRGADPLREAALGLVGLLPQVGGGVKFLLGHLWSAGPSLMDQMRDYVTGIAQALVDAEFLNTVNKKLAAMKKTFRNFETATSGADKGTWLTHIINDLDSLQQDAFDKRPPQTMLPYLITVGTLHLTALRERIDKYAEYYGKPSDNPGALVTDLKADIKAYSDNAKAAREGTLNWRMGLITAWSEKVNTSSRTTYEVFYAKDDYTGWRFSADRRDQNIDQRRALRDSVHAEYTRIAREQFTAELDGLGKPASAWKYLDPTVTDRPKVTPVVITSATYGSQNGTKFDTGSVASLEPQIAEIKLWFNNDGNRLHGIHIRKRDGKTVDAGEKKGKEFSKSWNGDEQIVGAYGIHQGPLESLYFVSNRNHIMGFGQRTHGGPFGSEPPLPGAVLNSIFGWANGDRIEGIGFRWAYGRHE